MLPLLIGCMTSDYGLNPAVDDPDFLPTEDLGEGAAIAAWERSTPHGADEPPVREELFVAGIATPTAVADYLFVIDESVSMRKVMSQFRRGIRSLLRPGVFPRAARLAVMNTTPADPDDLTRPHPATRAIPGERDAPGFLRLIDHTGLAHYREVAPDDLARRYPLAGCTDWFTPRQRNDQGRPCLKAHTQIARTPVGAEAGLVALSQWLEKTAGTARFRPGAAVNVVFISDTHDPGINSADLRDLKPTLDELLDLIEADDVVASFRLHAIAPDSDCSESWQEPTYFQVAAESDGVTADVCTITDYASVIGEIARTGAFIQRPVFALGYPAADVLSVTLDGEAVEFSVEADGAVVHLFDEPENSGVLRIRYQR